MAASKLNEVIQHLRRIVLSRDGGGLTDRQLLDEFISRRDEAALAALVRRHGPMVWAVCSRTLRNNHDAEDAFQSTFLVLVRKAASVSPRDMVGNWLYGVAHQTALNARATAMKKRAKEQAVADMAEPLRDDTWHDLLPFLDHELSRLPDKYRAVIVLCDLEGKSRKEAAKQLRVPQGTIAGNLARARAMLAKRMARHCPEITGAALAATLSQNANASVPPLIETNTIKVVTSIAAGQTAAEVISVQVMALTEGVLKTMLLKQLKVVAAVLLVLGTVVTIGGSRLLIQDSEAAAQKPAIEKVAGAADLPKGEPNPLQAKPKDDATPAVDQKPERVTIRGRVLDAAGKAIAHADVAAVGWAEDVPRQKRSLVSLVDGKTDEEGRFRIELPERDTAYTRVSVGAKSPGRALSGRELDSDSWQGEVELRLQPEHAWRGQFLDLQGMPAAGVRVEVSDRFETSVLHDPDDPSNSFSSFASGLYSSAWNPERKLERWRASATTDTQGQFVLHGLRAGWHVGLKVNDERFGPQEFLVDAAKQNDDKGFVGILAPKRVLEGVVTAAADGKPVSDAQLRISTRPTTDRQPTFPVYYASGRADERGRFRITLPTGKHVEVTASAPTGLSLSPQTKSIAWPSSGTLKQEMNLALPQAKQGIVVRGIIKEVSSGKPIHGANVHFHSNRDNNPFYRADFGRKNVVSDIDGKFEIMVLPGPGHLLVDGPTLDYLHDDITTQALYGGGIFPNRRNYYDAIVPLQLKPQTAPHEMSVVLRRGVTLSGSVAGPDNQPVREAILLCRSYLEDASDWNGTHKKRVTGGRFSLPGCDPERRAEVFFVDEKNRWGALANLSGKDAGKPIAVRLERCGSVSVRLIDEKGKPVPNFDGWVEFVITPGANMRGMAFDAIDPKTGKSPVPAETACAPYATCRGNTDADGRITFHCLIPGATYELGGQSGLTGGSTRLRGDIRVQPGQALDLGEIEVKARKR